MARATATLPDAHSGPDAPTHGADVGAEAAGKPKRSRKRLLVIVGVVLLLLAGGGLGAKSLLASPGAPAPDPSTVPGDVLSLDSITLNLADGRYLKLTLALQLSQAATPAAGSVDAAAAAGPAVDGAKALDAAIDILGSRTYAQLLVPAGRTAAQKALSAEVRKRYPGKVLQVYFKEFLMQ